MGQRTSSLDLDEQSDEAVVVLKSVQILPGRKLFVMLKMAGGAVCVGISAN